MVGVLCAWCVLFGGEWIPLEKPGGSWVQITPFQPYRQASAAVERPECVKDILAMEKVAVLSLADMVVLFQLERFAGQSVRTGPHVDICIGVLPGDPPFKVPSIESA